VANNSSDIRRLMSLVESIQEPVLLEGWLTNLRNKRIRRLGSKERAEMANRLKQEWLKWLGQTGRQGTDDDMDRFMRVRIGFSDKDVAVVKDKVFDDSKTKADNAPSSDTEDQTPPQRKISRGNEIDDTKGNKNNAADSDEDDGVPIPKDLNTKLSDFGKVGVDVEKNDNRKEPGEIKANPKDYRLPNGEWDREKISAQLAKMPVGDKLTLGSATFSRSIGKPQNPQTQAESIMEADSDVLSDEVVDDLMDASAGHINDEYLLNGPVNDTNDAIADLASQKMAQGSSRKSADSKPTSVGPYDIQEMSGILKRELEIGDAKLKQITQYVKDTADKGYGRMQDSDIDVLARIGYALLRSRT
jgi:hypothetical protein